MQERPSGITRRQALGGGIAALTALMLDPVIYQKALAQQTAIASDPRYEFVDQISELVIPETDSPGASAVRAAGFVLLALDSGMSGLDPAMLERLRATLDNAAGGDFMGQPPQRQAEILERHDREAFAGDSEAGSPAHGWRRIKSAIVAAYYTSEIGATEELIYEPVPGVNANVRMSADYRDRSDNGFGGAI